MGRKPADNTELKHKIIEISHQIIGAGGIETFNVREVAKQAGCSLGMPYKIFSGVDDIVAHVNYVTLERLHELLLQVEQDDKPQRDKLYDLASEYLGYFQDNIHYWRLLFQYQYGQDYELPQFYNDKLIAVFATMANIVAVFVDDDPTEAMYLSTLMWSGIHGICALYLGGALNQLPLTSTDSLVDTLIDKLVIGLIGTDKK